jgi:hypothetical protein
VLRQTGRIRRRRFGHIFASARLKTVSCESVTTWRENGLSDHAAIEATFKT